MGKEKIKVNGKLGFVLGFVVGVVLVFGAFFSISAICGTGYHGKLVLDEQGYKEFKSVIAREDVKIQDLNVLSSEAPIIVDFFVTAKLDFPYGSPTTSITMLVIISLVAGVLFGFIGKL